MIGSNRHTARRAVLALAVLALLAVLAPASASAAPSTAWDTPCGSIDAEPFFCTVIINNVRKFTSTPGHFLESKALRGDVTLTKGEHLSSSANDFAYVSQSMWSVFGNSGWLSNLKDVVAETKVSVASSSLTSHAVSVVASGPHVSQEVNKNGITASTLFGLTCTSESYLTCITPGTWRDNRTKNLTFTQYPERFTGFAWIESRPLIVKVINMTSQPLVPDGSVRVDNMLRSQSIATPTRIDGLSDTGRPGVGYYHLYRDSSQSASVSLSYRFADGPAGEIALSRELVDATVDVSKVADATGGESTWSTDKSKCEAPTALGVSVQCDVTMLGSADGTLEAVVVVNG